MMSKSSQSPDSHDRTGARRTLLRRADQATVAALLAVALAAMLGYWWQQGGRRGELIDIEKAPRRAPAYLVDINEAQWPELAQLPGIGETLAKRIVDSRGIDGPFLDLDDVQRIQGIGPRTVERLRPYLLPMPRSEAVVTE